MKYVYMTFFCLIALTSMSQKMPDEGFYKVRITLPDMTIVAEINPVSSTPSAKPNLFYFWYQANAIHSTQGEFSGKLLNGIYTEYYSNKNLKKQGAFKKGLKTGVWKSWKDDGTLTETTKWENGIQVSMERVPLWKKLNPFKHKQESDTLKKTGQ